ncbi:MAG: hypothetical protein ACUVWR_06425 [Anaerolineae bacterium]
MKQGEIGPSLAAFGQEFGKVLDPVVGMPTFAVFLDAWRQSQTGKRATDRE